MNTDREQQLLEQIDRYLSSELAPKEAAKFEKQMANDAELRAKVQEEQVLIQLLAHIELDQLRIDAQERMNYLEGQPKKVFSAQKESKLRLFLQQAIKIAAVLIITFIGYTAISLPSKGFVVLYKSLQRQPIHDLVGIHHQRSTTISYQKDKVINASFEAQNYDKAIEQLRQLPLSDTVLLNKSVCYLYLNKGQEAIDALIKIQKNYPENKNISDKVAIYLARAYILQQQEDKAIPILEQIAQENSDFGNKYRQEARQLLKEIKELDGFLPLLLHWFNVI